MALKPSPGFQAFYVFLTKAAWYLIDVITGELPLNISYGCHHGNCCKSFSLVQGFQLLEIPQGRAFRLLFSRFQWDHPQYQRENIMYFLFVIAVDINGTGRSFDWRFWNLMCSSWRKSTIKYAMRDQTSLKKHTFTSKLLQEQENGAFLGQSNTWPFYWCWQQVN